MQTSVTHSTEEHFFFVKGALTHLAMGHLGGGAVSGVGRGGGGCKGVLRLQVGASGSEAGLSR